MRGGLRERENRHLHRETAGRFANGERKQVIRPVEFPCSALHLNDIDIRRKRSLEARVRRKYAKRDVSRSLSRASGGIPDRSFS